jgi:hypothetical protein
MGLRPGWRFLAILNPMDQGGLVAPLREPRHNPAVHARLHKGAHRRLVTPDGAGPESAIGIAEYSYREASRRPLGLVRRTDRLENKLRQVAPPPNPETRDGHEGHSPNNAPWVPASRVDRQSANTAAAITYPVVTYSGAVAGAAVLPMTPGVSTTCWLRPPQWREAGSLTK